MVQAAIRPVEILLVEDSPADVRLTEEALKDGKVLNNLNVVGDGEKALAYLRREKRFPDAARPDLILLDLNLPRKDGRDVLEEIKRDPNLVSIPVVVLSTSSDGKDIVKSYELRAYRCMTKPIDLEQFIRVVKSVKDFRFNAAKTSPQ